MIDIPAALEDASALFAGIERTRLADSIGTQLRSVAGRHPHRVALRLIEGDTYTYMEFAAAVCAAAGALSARGVTRASRLAVLLPNIAEFPIAYLAAATLGACVVPVNTAFTAAEIEYVLRDSGATFAIVDESLRLVLERAVAGLGTLPPDNVFIVNGADETRCWTRLCRASTPLAGDFGSLDALMTIQYTSGTTGFPKGALLTQKYWLVLGLAQSVELAHLDVRNILVVHSFFYMDPFWQMMLAFVLGGSVVLAPRMSSSRFMPWVREFDIHYALVSSLIFKQPPSEHDAHHNLRLLQTYGFSREIHADFEARFQVPVREIYGMTEIGGGTFLPLSARDRIGSGSVGIAAPFRRLKIVDETGVDVPEGDVGELWVNGEGLFSGYNNLPQANAGLFRDGWMATGDLFRRDRDGYYYLVGRLKDMVRRNMENVSTHEVEQVLVGHAAVIQAAVLSVPDAQRGEEVLALVVLKDGESPDGVSPQAIRDHCATRLAKFKLPRYVGYRMSLPMTPSGKVAKGQLRKDSPDLRLGTFDLETASWLELAPGSAES